MKTYFLRESFRNKNLRKIHHSESGFSLIELAVIVVMIGIFSAIAAPVWDVFVSRQRVGAVNNQVLQALQSAQAEAKRTKQNVEVTFNFNSPTVDPPTYTLNGVNPQKLNIGGEIKEEMITLSPNAAKITFNHIGAVDKENTTIILPFKVVVAPAGSTNSSSQRCVIVQTILGAMRTAEGSDCQ
ncbi:MAG: transcriptional regulator [Limnoraphis robusta]